jgi:hypothetical protein
VVGVKRVEPASTILERKAKGSNGWKKFMTSTPFFAERLVTQCNGKRESKSRTFVNSFSIEIDWVKRFRHIVAPIRAKTQHFGISVGLDRLTDTRVSSN